MRSHLIILLFLSCVTAVSFGQEVAVGAWRDHLPYRKTIAVAESPNYVYAATPYSLFRYEKTEHSIERITKIWGLSDVGVSAIRYHDATNSLLIGYTNGNLDLIIDDNDLINISAIKISNVLGDKSVNRVHFIGDLAYLACGFGIVVLDMKKHEIKESYVIGAQGSLVNCTDITDDGSNLWVATQEGLYTASLANVDLSNFASWTKSTTVPFPNDRYDEVEWFDGKLLLNRPSNASLQDTLYRFDGNSWDVVPQLLGSTIHSIEVMDDRVIFSLADNVITYNQNWEQVHKIFDIPGGNAPAPRHAIASANGTYWFADNGSGMVKSVNAFNSEIILPAGPWSNAAYYLRSWGDKMLVSAGGPTSSWANRYIADGVSVLEDGAWTYINSSTSSSWSAFGLRDIVGIAVDPGNPNRYWFSSLGRGVAEIVDNVPTILYDTTNSSLERVPSSSPTFSFVGAAGLETDVNNNLWATCRGTSKLLHVRLANGTWVGYDLAGVVSNATPSYFIINQLNQKWIVLTGSAGILVYDDNFTPANQNDDKVKQLGTSAGNGGLPSGNVLALAEGLEGEIWVGTDKGVAVFFNPGNVFTGSDFDAQQILVTSGGYTGHLLETETVTAIAIDAANRKWVGTDGAGVFLLSADGTEEIHHFTRENSPLLSNSVTDIELNHITGEVFFATTLGLIGFKSTATGGSADYANIFAYPNPVNPGYEGDIAIRGLVQNSNVKITDISGNLVFEGIADGGQAVWNGRTLNGDKVQTGVYLVFCADSSGKEKAVTKLLVLR